MGWLWNIFKRDIGAEYITFVDNKIVTVNEKRVFLVDCKKSNRQVFLKANKDEEFYVRTGPSSTKLSSSKMIEYISAHFKVKQ